MTGPARAAWAQAAFDHSCAGGIRELAWMRTRRVIAEERKSWKELTADSATVVVYGNWAKIRISGERMVFDKEDGHWLLADDRPDDWREMTAVPSRRFSQELEEKLEAEAHLAIAKVICPPQIRAKPHSRFDCVAELASGGRFVITSEIEKSLRPRPIDAEPIPGEHAKEFFGQRPPHST
jgi:hypothetical protein